MEQTIATTLYTKQSMNNTNPITHNNVYNAALNFLFIVF